MNRPPDVKVVPAGKKLLTDADLDAYLETVAHRPFEVRKTPAVKPFTDEEIAAMARAELEGDLPEVHARFLATIWERDARESKHSRGPRCSACGQPESHQDHHGQIDSGRYTSARDHPFQKADQ